MNEQDNNQLPADPLVGQRGFEDESAAGPAPQADPKRGKSAAELKANFNSVFGHGLGKASLVLVLVFLVIAAAFAIRGLNKPAIAEHAAQVDVPRTPAPKVTVDPIDPKEAERRSQLATLEAEAAARQGQTYQPGFNPVITAQQPMSASAVGFAPPLPPAPAQPVEMVIPPVPGQNSNQAAQQTAEEQKSAAEFEKQRSVRDKYVDQLRSGVEAQAEDLLSGKGKDGGIGGRGTYSTVSYVPRLAVAGTGSGMAGAGGAGTAAGGLPPAPGAAASADAASSKRPIIKAGKAYFATLDSEVNTDDGGDVFATVRGGPFNGAKLIGKIEQAPRNIRLKFTTLAPQDDRPTLSINAVAIREDDARQGVAEHIDHHTLSRYTALFAGAFLTGIGRAAAQPTGDTIVLPNGQVIVSQPEVTNKRIAMFALGEVGISAGGEIRKAFGQPPTYSTPTQKGIGIIFLADVAEK